MYTCIGIFSEIIEATSRDPAPEIKCTASIDSRACFSVLAPFPELRNFFHALVDDLLVVAMILENADADSDHSDSETNSGISSLLASLSNSGCELNVAILRLKNSCKASS